MSKVIKPLSVIILAVAVAAGAARFLSRQADEPVETASVADSKFTDTGGGQFRGPLDGKSKAQITLVEFGDYQCPSCGAYFPLVNEVLARYPQQLRLEFHHYPLISIHPNAMAAHKAVEAAGEQGKYWEMHDLVFEYQPVWSQRPNPEPDFLALAGRIGLNQNAFMQAMRSPAVEERILKDVVRAREANVEAVPTFFINGEQVFPRPSVEDFSRIIDEHLKTSQPVTN